MNVELYQRSYIFRPCMPSILMDFHFFSSLRSTRFCRDYPVLLAYFHDIINILHHSDEELCHCLDGLFRNGSEDLYNFNMISSNKIGITKLKADICYTLGTLLMLLPGTSWLFLEVFLFWINHGFDYPQPHYSWKFNLLLNCPLTKGNFLLFFMRFQIQ